MDKLIPVFASDSGLYIEGIEAERQPGVHVRRVGGKELTDEEMIDYMDIESDRISTNDRFIQGFRNFFMRTVLSDMK